MDGILDLHRFILTMQNTVIKTPGAGINLNHLDYIIKYISLVEIYDKYKYIFFIIKKFESILI